MSAFMLTHDHIDALLTFAELARLKDQLTCCIDPNDRRLGFDNIGRVLLAENERSVCEAYPHCQGGSDMPGAGQDVTSYRFQPFAPMFAMTALQRVTWVLKACQCYDYQACETDDYCASIACGIINSIRETAITQLPDYNKAPWVIDRSKVTA